MALPEIGNKVYFPKLNVLRFLSAFAIFLMHIVISWRGKNANTELLRDSTGLSGHINIFIANMTLGVDVFFLISGFLITYLLLREKELTNKIDLKKFFARRILRIWPLYFLLIAITPFILRKNNLPVSEYISSLLFVENFRQLQTMTSLQPFGHLWSICIEEHFYLVWPFIIAFVNKKWLMPLFSTILATSAAFVLFTSITNQVDPSWVIYHHTLSRIDVLVVGAIIAYYYHYYSFKINFPVYVQLLIYAALGFACFYTLAYYYPSPITTLAKRYGFILVITIAVLNYTFNSNDIFKFMNTAWLEYLGKISYGIYMFTPFVLKFVHTILMQRLHITNFYVYTVIMLIPGILVPIISYEFFEKPFLKLKGRFEIIRTLG
jgi:peptidoglycan/LPS O-acetylase OafA/YrhL